MFEKDAIRHAFENTIGIECLDKPVEDFSYEELSDELQEKAFDFKAGAEFGYNKAKEEVEDSYREALCNSELNLASVTEQLEELEKANEWHYVKDGDLPKHDHEVLCILWGDTREIGYYKNEVWYFENFSADNEDVDYWQEIIPPKEIE